MVQIKSIRLSMPFRTSFNVAQSERWFNKIKAAPQCMESTALNPTDLNPLKPKLSRYSQRETLWVEWLPVYIWRTQFLTSSILTTWRWVSVRWPLSSGVIALKLKHIMIIIRASKPKTYTILKYTQIKTNLVFETSAGSKLTIGSHS